MRILVLTCLLFSAAVATAAEQCGEGGVWLQILGSGGPELTDRRASASYVLWVDDQAKVLVDPGPGSALRFEEAGARFEDLDAILLSQLSADHTSDLTAFLGGSAYVERKRSLAVLGPATDAAADTTIQRFLERAIGRDGLYPHLASLLEARPGGYQLRPMGVPSTGSRRWSRFGTETVRVASIPVHHGRTPAVAWRVEAKGLTVTFAGDFDNEGNLMQSFAKGTDALVIHHAVGEGVRGTLADEYVTPTQIGRIAAESNARMLILGHRMMRTRGIETQSEAAIRRHFANAVIFANDLECWGL